MRGLADPARLLSRDTQHRPGIVGRRAHCTPPVGPRPQPHIQDQEEAMTTQTLDPAKAEAFAGQVIGMLNGGMTSLMISVGHRTGLFDRMASMPPSTSG